MVLCTKALFELFEHVFAAILWATVPTAVFRPFFIPHSIMFVKRERERERERERSVIRHFQVFLEMLSISKRDHVHYLDRCLSTSLTTLVNKQYEKTCTIADFF